MNYPHGHKFLAKLIKDKRLIQDLIKMSLQEDTEGFTPFLSYFNSLRNLFENYNFSHCINNLETREYIRNTFIPEGVNSLKQVVALYANQLKYDVSSRVGLSKEKKEEAKELLNDKGISQAQYNQLINLRFPEPSTEALQPTHSDEFYDDIITFNPLKKQLGLLDVKIE